MVWAAFRGTFERKNATGVEILSKNKKNQAIGLKNIFRSNKE
jgi:hypothetical protein